MRWGGHPPCNPGFKVLVLYGRVGFFYWIAPLGQDNQCGWEVLFPHLSKLARHKTPGGKESAHFGMT